MNARTWLGWLGFVALLISFTHFNTAAHPLNFITVTTPTDTTANDGFCSLREAVQSANTDSPSGGAAGECPAGGGADFITLPSGTYSLAGRGDNTNATGDLDILSDISIDGSGAVTITLVCTACEADRLFDVHSTGSLALYDVTLLNGRAPGNVAYFGTQPPPGDSGGAIRSAGSLILARVSLIGSRAGMGNWSQNSQFPPSAGGHGGAIAITDGIFSISDTDIENNWAGDGNGIDPDTPTEGGSGGALYQAEGTSGTITRTLMKGNKAGISPDISFGNGNPGGNGGAIATEGILSVGHSVLTTNATGYGVPSGSGGAIFVGESGNLTLLSSTLSGNNTFTGLPDNGRGGGIYLAAAGNATITNSTIVENSTPPNNAPGGGGGGIYSAAPVNHLTIANSIVANNRVGSNAPGIDCAGAITSGGYLFLENTVNCVVSGGVGNRFGQDPALLALANNGGNTLTHALAANSPALDVGSCTQGLDQRGYSRPFDLPTIPNAANGCDMGAFEADVLIPTITPTGTATPTPTRTPTVPPGTATVTSTPTIGPSPTHSATPTTTATPTPLGTPTPTGTPGGPPTLTPTVLVTRTPMGPPTLTPTPGAFKQLYLPLVRRT